MSKFKTKKQKYFVLQLKSGNAIILKQGLTFKEIKKQYPRAKPMFPIEKDYKRLK